MASSVFRIGRSKYAPWLDDRTAIETARHFGCDCAVVVAFHSDLPLKGARKEWFNLHNYAYTTNNYGEVAGHAYVIPVTAALGTLPLKEGEFPCFRLPDGTVIGIEIQPGCPECPARARVVEAPDV